MDEQGQSVIPEYIFDLLLYRRFDLGVFLDGRWYAAVEWSYYNYMRFGAPTGASLFLGEEVA